MNHGGMAMDHSAHAMGGGMAMGGPVRVRHAKTEYGPSTDMRVDTPRTNLDDPGIGLRNNGRRVLTYADLHTHRWPDRSTRSGAGDRAASHRQHGALHLVARWPRVRQVHAGAFPLRRAAARDPRQRHDDDPSDAPARHVAANWKARTAASRCASTPSVCNRRSASASSSPPMRWAAGHGTAT